MYLPLATIVITNLAVNPMWFICRLVFEARLRHGGATARVATTWP
jgi:hypothetical protein